MQFAEIMYIIDRQVSLSVSIRKIAKSQLFLQQTPVSRDMPLIVTST